MFQHVHHGQKCKSVQGDLFVRPTVRGQKVKQRSKCFNMFTTVKHAKVSTVTSLSDLRLGVKRSKKGQLLNNVKLYN